MNMKRAVLFFLLLIGSIAQGQNFLDSAYLVNPNPYSVRRLVPNDTTPALQRLGNLIYRGADSSLYFSSGYQWILVPKSAGVPRNVNFTTAVYTLDTWTANGAKVKVVAEGGNATVQNIRFVIHRIHRARNGG